MNLDPRTVIDAGMPIVKVMLSGGPSAYPKMICPKKIIIKIWMKKTTSTLKNDCSISSGFKSSSWIGSRW